MPSRRFLVAVALPMAEGARTHRERVKVEVNADSPEHAKKYAMACCPWKTAQFTDALGWVEVT